ncbi:MAG: 50S ribosomal protein L25 [Chlamydiota bacterium]
MKLAITKRLKDKKKDVKRLRRAGAIPAVIYSGQNPAENITVEEAELQAILRSIPKGSLSTKVLTLVDDQGKERKAIVKDIQYHVTSYDIIHLDFEELYDDRPVNINVPINYVGVEECKGIKLGGFLRKILRRCKVRCLPADIPTDFEIDVSDLGLQQSCRLKAIELSKGITPLYKMEDVAVIIAKR